MADPEVRRGRAPAQAWRRVTYGLYRRPDPAPGDDADATARGKAYRTSVIADLRAWHQVLRPGACFTHLSSAIARGWWLPELPDDLPVWIAQAYGQNPTVRPGAVVMRRKSATPYDEIDGIRLALPAETIVDCAQDLGLLDVVLLVDGALHSGAASLEELAAVATQRRRGAPALREALRWCDPRTESAWETPLRILHRACGIAVEPQHVVRNRFGGFVARGDLLIVGTRQLHEYDGAGHRDPRQHRADLERERGILDAGYTRRGYTASDLAQQPHRVVLEACSALGVEFDFVTMRAWWPLWKESCFSEEGRIAFAARVARKTAGTGDRRRVRKSSSPAVVEPGVE